MQVWQVLKVWAMQRHDLHGGVCRNHRFGPEDPLCYQCADVSPTAAQICYLEYLQSTMERPDRLLIWMFVPGHVGLEGNDAAHGLAVEGMCLSAL